MDSLVDKAREVFLEPAGIQLQDIERLVHAVFRIQQYCVVVHRHSP